jgi:hypothetical protein
MGANGEKCEINLEGEYDVCNCYFWVEYVLWVSLLNKEGPVFFTHRKKENVFSKGLNILQREI